MVLVVIGFLLKQVDGVSGSGIGWKFGSFLALIAAVVAIAPVAMPIIQARQAPK